MAPKKKQEKMSLGNFLSDPSYGSWAEEMDDMPLPSSSRNDSRSGGFGGERREFGSRPGGFGGDRDFGGDRPYQQREQLPLPSKPPYTAHLGNLSFDVTQADIEDYFTACQVTNVRIVEDKLDRKPKGFGYVEFETLDGLKKALELNGTQFQGRNIRVSVADPPKDRADGREFNDWTRKGPLPDLPASNQRRPSDRGYRQVDAASDAGSDRGSRRGPPPEAGDGRVRDFGNWERKGPLAPAAAPPAPAGPAGEGRGSVRRNDRSFDRRASPSWGEGRSQDDGSRPPRREFQERPAVEKPPTAAEMDSQWRARMKPDAPVKSPTPTPDPSTPSSPVATMAVPASRPRLNLQKRTVSDATAAAQATSAESDAKASPFGAARPIDTATREKEIEEKRLALRQKKEEEDREREAKAKAEKAAAAAAKSAEAGPTTTAAATSPPPNAPTGPRENGRPSASKESGKENGANAPVQGRSFEILRRMADQENGDGAQELGTEAGEHAIEAPANGPAVPEKDLQLQEIATEAVASSAKEQPEANVEGVEDDGWNTVTKPTRKGRGGPSRAVAS